jgi:hypothetical protein
MVGFGLILIHSWYRGVRTLNCQYASFDTQKWFNNELCRYALGRFFILTLLESDPWAAFLKLEKIVVKFAEFFTVFHTLAI